MDEPMPPGADETWVVPLRQKSIPPRRYSQLVYARFVLWNGRVEHGFMDVTTAESPISISPGAIVTSGYLSLPMVPPAVARRDRNKFPILERERVLAGLKLKEPQVFPMQYLLLAPIGKRREFLGGLVL
ncbi:MAG: hypothetical protein SF069_12950 [Phycisphaerae bacterium]|nr:hypothetical protein [Phycisphaerae bacterium]